MTVFKVTFERSTRLREECPWLNLVVSHTWMLLWPFSKNQFCTGLCLDSRTSLSNNLGSAISFAAVRPHAQYLPNAFDNILLKAQRPSLFLPSPTEAANYRKYRRDPDQWMTQRQARRSTAVLTNWSKRTASHLSCYFRRNVTIWNTVGDTVGQSIEWILLQERFVAQVSTGRRANVWYLKWWSFQNVLVAVNSAFIWQLI